MNISLEKIGKQYTSDWIFREVSETFSSGNIYGVIGHNGSGKSTLLQIISGFVTPSEGSITYNDGSIEVSEVFNYLTLSAPYAELPSEFTVEETILNQTQFKPLKSGMSLEVLLRSTELTDHRNKTLDKLSSGMRQRLKLALAIFAESDLLLLDEPCANLDKKWSDWFLGTLTEHASGRVVIIGSNSDQSELASCNQPLIDVSAH